EKALSFFTGRGGKQNVKVFQIWLDTLEKMYHKILKKMEVMITKTKFKTLEELRTIFHYIE
ncbi:MAG: hypothetical protein ACFFD5_16180, partial [Candidatus Thorarchaeota archaeon]